MSANWTVTLECDARLDGGLCRATFNYGTTNIRRTREAAEAEGWATGFAVELDDDFCPAHRPGDLNRVKFDPPLTDAEADAFWAAVSDESESGDPS